MLKQENRSKCELSSVLQIKQTYVYNNVKLLPIGTIQPVAPQNDILEQNIFLFTK